MENNIELSMAWDFVEKTGANLFLTGKAGTGKTTFLRQLRQRSPKRMVVLAPTGIAAINAGGSTIHSFFQLSLSPYVPGATFGSKDQRRFRLSKMKRNIIRTLDLLVIDEVSMVRADLLDAVDSVMRQYRDHGKPFGGAQLLLIGDLLQLAPVVKDDEWEMLKAYYDTPFFFSSHALNQTAYQTIELKRVYRQQDAEFLNLLNRLRDGLADESTLAQLNRRYLPGFVPPEGDDYIRLTTHNYQAQAINERELSKLPSKPFTYRASIEGTFPEHAYPAEPQLTLKVGAQVMFLKNAPDRSYYNGMIGRVAYADERAVTIYDKATGRAINLEMAEWSNSRYTLDEQTKEITETVEGVFRQYPLRLAWAITIHKSQGLTFDHAIIDASHSFAHGQAYVALSRCKTLEGLVLGAPLSSDAIIIDDTVGRFTARAEAQRPTEAILTALKREFVVQTLDELFDIKSLRQAMEMVVRTLSEHFFNKLHTLLTEYSQAMQHLGRLVEVSRKFGDQYRRMLQHDGDLASPQLQERIHSGARYFAEQLGQLQPLLTKTHVAAGARLAVAQLDERRATLAELMGVKLRLLTYEADAAVEFSTGDYLSHKARALLGQEDAKPAQRSVSGRKPQPAQGKPRPSDVEPSQPKRRTHEVSHDMFTHGMTIEQIAEQRSLSRGTVFSHLAQYVVDGHLPLDQIVPQEHIDLISNYVAQHPDIDKLQPVKDALGEQVSYDEIRLVLNVLK